MAEALDTAEHCYRRCGWCIPSDGRLGIRDRWRQLGKLRSLPDHLYVDPAALLGFGAVQKGDYETAGVPMLPVVAGETNTRHQILVYSILLAPIGVAPYFMGYASLFYGVASGLLGLAFVAMAADIWRKREGDVARKACLRLFKFSIFYLFMLFALLLGESLVAGI